MYQRSSLFKPTIQGVVGPYMNHHCYADQFVLITLHFGWEDWNSRRQTGNVNAKTHQTRRAAHIGQKYDDPDARAFAEFCLALDRVYNPLKVGCYTDRCCQSHRPDEVVEDIKSGVDSQKALPLPRGQGTQSGLFRKPKPPGNEQKGRNDKETDRPIDRDIEIHVSSYWLESETNFLSANTSCIEFGAEHLCHTLSLVTFLFQNNSIFELLQSLMNALELDFW